MGRYDQRKGKRAGRYNPAKGKSNDGVYVLVVIILMLLAGAGGFFAKQLMDGLKDDSGSGVRTLVLPPESASMGFAGAPGTGDVQQQAAGRTNPGAVDDGMETLPPVEQLAALPELDSSDAAVRLAITQAAPELAPWLATGQLIRAYMTVVNDFSQGQIIAKHMRFLKLGQWFTVSQNNGTLVMAASSYHRYDPLAQAINAIDAPAIGAVYKKFQPLLLQVFSEFSYPPEYHLEDIFNKAAAEILAAPVLDEPIALVRFPSHYKFADPQLEALNPVHKQMIRMGPQNTRIIQNKVRLLVSEIGG
ncbi:MAG: DUF3014 domain-containing protein [Methylovulum sp.]|nr:DUF3014 domain-containing protein [Methylovulum sp.]